MEQDENSQTPINHAAIYDKLLEKSLRDPVIQRMVDEYDLDVGTTTMTAARVRSFLETIPTADIKEPLMDELTNLYTFDIIPNRSGRHGVFDDIWLVDESGELYVTYVDPTYRNRGNWRTITNNPDSGFIMHNCKAKLENKRIQKVLNGPMHGATIINADSKPKITDHLTAQDLRDFIEEAIVPNIKKAKRSDDSDDLFEFGKFKT